MECKYMFMFTLKNLARKGLLEGGQFSVSTKAGVWEKESRVTN